MKSFNQYLTQYLNNLKNKKMPKVKSIKPINQDKDTKIKFEIIGDDDLKYVSSVNFEVDEEFISAQGKNDTMFANKIKKKNNMFFRDPSFEKRKVALECSVSYLKDRKEATKENVVGIAQYFFKYLNNELPNGNNKEG